MEGLMTFTGLVVIVFGILQIILFFKMWVMANATKRIWEKINMNDSFRKACVCFVKGEIDETERLLNESFLQEIAEMSALANDYSEWDSGFIKIQKKYSAAFGNINKPAPDFKKYHHTKIFLA